MKISRIIGVLVFVIILFWVTSTYLKKDEYTGFYYPDAGNLTYDIESSGTFDSLEACRDWVDEQVTIYNLDDSSYDYECGKNCDLSNGKPYICEETLE